MNANGAPYSGAKLYFYTTGTTTPITVYQDSGGSTPHASPVVADAAGLFAPIYVTNATFKFVLKDASGNIIQTVDPAFAQLSIGGTFYAGDGLVGTPSITFNADQDSGIYRIGDNDWGLVAGGALIAEISGNGLEVKDTLFTIKDNSDATKKATFEASGITTGTSRKFTFPDSDGTLALTSTANLQTLFQGNVGLVAAVSASALTVSLKGVDGNDPSSSNAVVIPFRSATAATGTPVVRSVTGAKSVVVASTKTLGTANGVPFRLWIVAVDTGSDIELGIVNCLSGTSIMALRDGLLYSPTATPGNSAQVIYTSSGQTAKPICILGYMDFSSGEATAGTWATAPDKIQPYKPGTALPGDVLQTVASRSGALATGTTVIPFDNTIPQNTEGDQYMSQAITPTSAANLLVVTSQINLSNPADSRLVAALFRDSTASAVGVTTENGGTGAPENTQLFLEYAALATSASSTTFKMRAGAAGAGTTSFNGLSGVGQFGGTLLSYLSIVETMT